MVLGFTGYLLHYTKVTEEAKQQNKNLTCSTKSYSPNQNNFNILNVLSTGPAWEENVGFVAGLFSLNF